ncbi:hypothetical protein V6N13_109490 [Hibiscus sabdariffa]
MMDLMNVMAKEKGTVKLEDRAESTNARDERFEMQELKKKMTEMMDLMNVMAKEKGIVKLEDKSVEG